MSNIQIKILSIVLITSFLSCSTHYKARQTRFVDYSISVTDTLTQPSASVSALITPYRKLLEKDMNEIIGVAEVEMYKAQPEGGLGNWIADMTKKQTEKYYQKPIDFGVCNHGGIRLPVFSKGPVSVGKIFELLPFDNYLTLVFIDKSKLILFFEYMAKKGGWPVSNNVKFEFFSDGKIKSILIDGKAPEDRIYSIAMNDYVATGGDGCEFLIGTDHWESGVLIRDAMIDFVKSLTASNSVIRYKSEGRVSIVFN